TIIPRNSVCDQVIDCPDLSDECPCQDAPGICRRVMTFWDKSNEIYSTCGESYTHSTNRVCDGVADCDDRTDESNATCSERFYCPVLGGSKVISIDSKHVCDFKINCDDATDEMNCSRDGRFYCENGTPLFVSNKKMYDGNGDCTDWSDECPTHDRSLDNIFSSKYELIANPFLRSFVWIMGLFALGGNLCVLHCELQTFRRYSNKPGVSSSLRANHILVLNLAVSDLLIGVYLILLGGTGAFYSGTYCANKLTWLSSSLCDVMGVLVVTSSETSVITMVLLTSLRLYAVLNPFTSSTRPRTSIVLSLIAATWLISLLLAMLPHSKWLQGVFVQLSVIKDNPFLNNIVVDFETAKSFALRMYTYDHKLGVGSPGVLEDCHIFIYSNIRNPHNRYYSANSVCIPNLFVKQTTPSWTFTFLLLSLNLAAFIFVAASYIVVYIKSSRSSIVKRNSKGFVRTTALERKIVRLIASDFLCWVPVSVMGFLSIGGISIPDIAYVISATILLPINSALNPLLYSSFVDRMLSTVILRNRSS
uniref:G-protein coupled receptors family 1 profile domain-containing protein n=1 Tax=Ciona intestinalis TaxID=7719 RepID=H2XND0_CIOIN